MDSQLPCGADGENLVLNVLVRNAVKNGPEPGLKHLSRTARSRQTTGLHSYMAPNLWESPQEELELISRYINAVVAWKVLAFLSLAQRFGQRHALPVRSAQAHERP
jgi:hypothetical protein